MVYGIYLYGSQKFHLKIKDNSRKQNLFIVTYLLTYLLCESLQILKEHAIIFPNLHKK